MDHYYSDKPSSEEKLSTIRIQTKEDYFDIYSSSGLFSKSELDFGSRLLIENALITGSKGLDMGCGNGVIGLCLLRKNKLDMTFSDINERAIKICTMNLNKLKLNGKVIKSDLYDNIDEDFDFILSNPPYAAGRELCFKLIEDSFNHLKKRGTLQLVARHNKGGEMLSKKMMDIFGNVKTQAKSGGFRVYLSVKS